MFSNVPPPLWKRILRKLTDIVLSRLPTGRWLALIPGFQTWFIAQQMKRQDHTGLHSRIYATYAEALADIPPSRKAGWDLEESSTLWLDNIDPVRPSTYPVFFWITQTLKAGERLVDLGGSIGLTYYGLRRYMTLPEGASWTVVEVPQLARQGKAVAERENAGNLHFLDDLRAAPPCTVLLSAGAMQCMEHSVPGLIEQLAAKPRYILLNKLPVVPYEDCWTLHNYGPAVCPMRLYNERNFIAYFESAGYRLRDRWAVQDLDVLIPFHPERFLKEFSGFLFELAE